MADVIGAERLRVWVLLQEATGKIVRAFDQVNCKEHLDYINFRVKNLLNLVLRCSEFHEIDRTVIDMIQNVSNLTEKLCYDPATIGYKSPVRRDGQMGRPAFVIQKQQLEYYLESSFPVPLIANMLLVSACTVKRSLREFGLRITDTYCDINDEELDSKIREKVQRNPNCGYR
eukprot:gene1283-1415_t